MSVYASRRSDRPHLEPFFSPSFSKADWDRAQSVADAKRERLRDVAAATPWRLVTVGRLTDNKNQQTIVRAVGRLVRDGRDVVLDVYGDGPTRARLEALASEVGAADRIRFHGSVNHGAVMDAFADADLALLSTRQEGYGKVLLEGMVFGVVPIFGESPVAEEISGGGTRGLVFPPDDDRRLAELVGRLIDDRDRWADMSAAARAYTATVTLEAFQQRVREMLERQWRVRLRPVAAREAE